MAKITYSSAAINDLRQIGDYISETLKNPVTALNTVNKIQDFVRKLATFPLAGAQLSGIVNADTDYRFLVSGNYLVFYHAESDAVYIDRVIYGKRDYMAILFRTMLEDNTDQ